MNSQKWTLRWLAFALAVLLLQGTQARANSYGAFAGDPNSVRMGWSWGYVNPYEAIGRAMDVCGIGCQYILPLNNECGAFARANNGMSTQSFFVWTNRNLTMDQAVTRLQDYCYSQNYQCADMHAVCTF